MSLIGGETAEMPGMYGSEDYDIAGFLRQVSFAKKIISPKKVNNGDIIIGITSDGFHSNGFSLINKLIDKRRLNIHEPFGNTTIGKVLIKNQQNYM